MISIANEGKYYALKAARRLAQPQSEGERTAEGIMAGLQEQLSKAEVRLSHHQEAGNKNPDWLSYYQGEVDGYRQVLDWLEA